MKVSEESEIVGIDECEMCKFVYVYVGLKRMFVFERSVWRRAAMRRVAFAAFV